MSTTQYVHRSAHATLSTTTADTISWVDGPHDNIAVTNGDASALLYIRPYKTNEVQTITLSSWDSTDTIKFTHNAVESAAVTFASDVSAEIQAALESLVSIGTGNVLVTRTSSTVYVARFRKDKRGVDMGAITCTNGTGSATGSVAETIKGGSSVAIADADGTYKIPVSSTVTFHFDPAPSTISVVGSGNIYSVMGL